MLEICGRSATKIVFLPDFAYILLHKTCLEDKSNADVIFFKGFLENNTIRLIKFVLYPK